MNQERLLKLILSPHISEKTTIGAQNRNQYAFHVIESATKPEIQQAIEFLFNVKVKSVRIVSVRPKIKLFRGIEGKKKGWKKAYVTLQADQKLDLMGA
jgi:large subunit ribosomal protein L23